MKPKDFGITYEIRKRIKDVKMKKGIDLNIWNLKYLKWREML